MSEEFHPNAALIDRALADRSHSGTSWDPEKRAEQEISNFVQSVQDTYDRLSKSAKTEAQKAYLAQEMARFQEGYAQKYNEYLARHGRCISSFIAGPSNFPTRRAEKYNNSLERKTDEMQEFKDRAEKSILRELRKMAVEEAGGELVILARSIKLAEETQELMKACNSILRKKSISEAEKVKAIMAATGWDESTARKCLIPDFAGRLGFSYHLTNNSAGIKRMKARLAELQAKESTPTTSQEFPGGRITDDLELDRVCIYHDQKPAPEVILALKAEGWRWSPRACAWMRKRTVNSLASARRIIGL